MAVLPGALAVSPIGGTLSPALVAALNGYQTDYFPAHQDQVSLLAGGPIVSNLPVSTTGAVIHGAVALNYGSDFYRYFSFDPAALDVGFVSVISTFTFKLWNRNPVAVTLDSLTGVAMDGIATTLAVGAVFAPYQELTFSVVVSPDGPGIIAATLNLVFDVGGEAVPVTFGIGGVRARIWRYPPNWANGYTTNYAYKTEMWSSRSGKEVRRALRHNPRFYSEFEIQLSKGRLAEFETQLAGWQNRPFSMPDYADFSLLTSASAIGTDTVEVDAVESWMQAPGETLILSNGNEMSMHTITDIVGSTLTLSPILTQDWPVGTRAYRARTGYVAGAMQVDTPTNMVGRARIRFDALPRSGLPESVPAVDTIEGREIFLKRPNWATAPQVELTADMETVDFGRGTAAYFRIKEFTTKSVRATYTCMSRQEVREIREFFRRQFGMRGEFLAPTWKPDLVMAADILAGNNAMVVEGVDVFDYLNGSTVYQFVLVVKTDGTRVLNRVLSMTRNITTTTLSCQFPWPAVDTEDVVMVCWMPAWTLASDILTVNWVTDRVAQVSLTMRTIEND